MSDSELHRQAVSWTLATLRAGRTREEVSRAAGKNPQFVARIERCERSPSVEDLAAVLSALRASMQKFGELYDGQLARLEAEQREAEP